ncbi:glycosyltransferase [Candidatus Pelagibacter ubique]|nr:glycosyltransferase [Candidatus Pelagibacter ubique]
MKIGVFISKRQSFEGGGYTITEELLDTLINEISSKKISQKFFFLVSNDLKHSIINRLKIKKIKFKHIRENNIFKKIIIFISHFFPKSNLLLNYFNIIKINNIFKKENCNKILFISSEYREIIKVPYIATVWDMQHETHPNFMEVSSYGRNLYRKTVNNSFISQANKIIVGTETGRLEIMRYTKFNKEFIILPHPVSKIFLKKKKIIKKIKRKYFFYPANFWEHKNHFNLIKGFALFLKNNKNYNLILSGAKENNYNHVISLIKKLNISNKVKIVGHVSLNRLISLYDNCFATIYASFSGPENLPPMEALARKKNLINSVYPGAKEQLKKFPIYFNPKSPKDIAKAMLKSLKKKSLTKNKKIDNYLRSKFSTLYIKNLIKELIKI